MYPNEDLKHSPPADAATQDGESRPTVTVCDSHCHFFSQQFFQLLAEETSSTSHGGVKEITRRLGWESPGPPKELAIRWIDELDRNRVERAALIASTPGDEESVAIALAEYPHRFVGFFMVNPLQEKAQERVSRAISELGLKCVCLFPAMHNYRMRDSRVIKLLETSASLKAAVFVHCGFLSVGVRKKLHLPSNFPMHLSNPLDLHQVVSMFPSLPIIIPHFGAGFFREVLMLADACDNVYLDTSSSNNWIRYHPSLTLRDVFRQTLQVLGPERLLFGTDSSFFPRGWQRPIWETQATILQDLSLEKSDREQIFHGNFERLFPLP